MVLRVGKLVFKMKYLSVPSIGERVSCIALGVNKTGDKRNSSKETEKSRIAFYHKAIDMGVNFFDTAELYGGGYSEEVLGKALSNGYRNQIMICTKYNAKNSTREKLTISLENSLKRLNTEYVDFYLAHWPNPNVPFDDLLKTLETFKNSGKIRAYGLSNATAVEIQQFNEQNNGNFFVIENEYNLIDRGAEEEILPFVEDNNCLFLAYSPLIQGRVLKTDQEVDSLCEKYNCSLQQLFLAWIHQKNMVSLVRTMNESHLEDNISALNIKLEQSDQEILSATLSVSKTEVDVDLIEIDDRSYSNIHDAILNRDQLIPSPLLLSQRLDKDFKFSPLRLVKNGDTYRILDDFYMSEIKKFWAWKMSRHHSKKIEAYVFNDL